MVVVEQGNVAEFFGAAPLGRKVYDVVARLVDGIGPATARVTKSQVAFRNRRGFCWLWLPGTYLADPGAEVVLSLALDRQDTDPRWKQVVPVGRHWMHHLEVHEPADLDDTVAALLVEAYTSAA